VGILRKLKSCFSIYLDLLVLMVVLLNLYNVLMKNKYSVISGNIIVGFLAIDGFVSGVRYIKRSNSKNLGIFLVSLSSITIFLSAIQMILKLRFGI